MNKRDEEKKTYFIFIQHKGIYSVPQRYQNVAPSAFPEKVAHQAPGDKRSPAEASGC